MWPDAQGLAVCAAFWAAVAFYGPRSPGCPRFAAGLALGALAAQLAWFWPPRADPGASLLLLPAGLLVADRSAQAFAALPLPIALARLGCLAAGCCGAEHSVPLPAVEAACFGALQLGLRRVASAAVPGVFLAAFGAIRLLESPWRAAGPSRSLAVGLACAWLALGVVLACLSRGAPGVAARRRPRPATRQCSRRP
jgi:hypothetical protein